MKVVSAYVPNPATCGDVASFGAVDRVEVPWAVAVLRVVAASQEVTILADRSVPFSVVKKVMSTCTSQGFGRISLAVLQKGSETPQAS